MEIQSSQDSSEIQGIKHGKSKTWPMLSTYWVKSVYTEKSIFYVTFYYLCLGEEENKDQGSREER